MLTDDEIRLKIAELKGWKWVHKDQGGFFTKPILVREYPDKEYNRFNYWFVCQQPDDAIDLLGNLPYWATNIARAFELVEEARQSDVGMMMHNSVTITPVPGIWSYTCAFYDPIGGPAHKTYSAEADTAAGAICLAWLKWKGVEV